MWAGTNRLKNPPDRALQDKLTGEDGTLCMQSLAVVDHVFPSGPGRGCPCLFQLLKARKRRLIGEIIFAAVHNATSERASLAGHGRCRDEFDRGIIENLLKARSRLRLWELCAKGFDFRLIGIVDPPQVSSGLH